MIPINVIKEKLLSLSNEELTKDNVYNIINKMCICRILKSEDRSIKSQYRKNRPFDLDIIIKEVYEKIVIRQ